MRPVLGFAFVLFAASACSPVGPSACVPVRQGWALPEVGKAQRTAVNIVRLVDRRITWNGMDVSEETLRSYLRETSRRGLAAKKRNPEIAKAFVIYSPERAECDYARHVHDLLEANYPCSSGACGQGAPEDFVQRVN